LGVDALSVEVGGEDLDFGEEKRGNLHEIVGEHGPVDSLAWSNGADGVCLPGGLGCSEGMGVQGDRAGQGASERRAVSRPHGFVGIPYVADGPIADGVRVHLKAARGSRPDVLSKGRRRVGKEAPIPGCIGVIVEQGGPAAAEAPVGEEFC